VRHGDAYHSIIDRDCGPASQVFALKTSIETTDILERLPGAAVSPAT
jgi:hypothetical protein